MRSVEVQKSRAARAVDMAGLAVPFDREDSVAVDAIFHKSFCGNVLVAINASRRPVAAWRDIDGVVSIKSKLIKRAHFESIVRRLKPRTLYLNNGELLTNVLQEGQQNIYVYDSQTLVQILDEIRLTNTAKSTPSNAGSNGNNRISSNSNCAVGCDDGNKDLSYQAMRELDPTLTRREYNKLINLSCGSRNKNNQHISSNSNISCIGNTRTHKKIK